MQSQFAQQIALTTYGNAYLAGKPDVDWAGFWASNGAFAVCESVRFVDRGGREESAGATSYAADPVRWFERLARDGVSAVRLVCRTLSGERQPRWFNETIKPTGSDLWDCRWELGDRDRKDQKIWRVTYARIETDQPTVELPRLDVAELRRRFAATLLASGDLARKHGLQWFAKAFDAGRAALDGAATSGSSHDLAPASILPPYARDLLAAAQASWVFGGMGSWNDVGFEGEDFKTYERLSQELYQALNEAVLVSTNASARVGGGS